MAKRVTRKNLKMVLSRLTTYALAQEVESQRSFCLDLNAFLDDLACQDAFGTEGQLDPRGDQRNEV